jgi:hypothetical protein
MKLGTVTLWLKKSDMTEKKGGVTVKEVGGETLSERCEHAVE